jgi:hypothetical protein
MHLQAEDLELYALGRFCEPRSSEVEAHLASCPLCRSNLADAAEFAQALAKLGQRMAERRDGHRIAADDSATLQVLNPLSPAHWEVRILNEAKGGMCIRTAKPIEQGAQVKVQRADIIACGEVRYCIPVGESFHAGIVLREIVSGSSLRDA